MVKPLGVIVYAVCSLEPEENEEVVRCFLRKHPEFRVDTRPTGLVSEAADLVSEDGFFRTFPHRHAMDGFFVARLRRRK
jgi:16S rRNA (cytosine967-C5)-methyltransferase